MRSAVPTSQAPTLTSRRFREGSPNGRAAEAPPAGPSATCGVVVLRASPSFLRDSQCLSFPRAAGRIPQPREGSIIQNA